MIFATGDMHGHIDISKLDTKNFPQQKELTKNDYVVVCGDFGLTWDLSNRTKYWLDWLDDKPFTTLFVDGNHENFDLLDTCFVFQWNGGKIHRIRPSVIHLMRGQVFDIDGRTIFTMGGAESHDKEWRIAGRSWWKEEMPSADEYEEAIRNLDRVNNRVDLIFTHCAPTSLNKYGTDKLTDFLQRIKRTVEYDKWCFGHYHVDEQWGEKEFCLYNTIMEV